MTDELPSYTNETVEKREKNNHNVEKNTLLRSNWDKATYQAVKVTDTHVHTDDGEKHLHSELVRSIESGNVEVLGTRATV